MPKKLLVLLICLIFLPAIALAEDTFSSLKGTIEEIKIYGHQWIKEEKIRREITLKVGEKFDLEKAFESRQNIISNLGHIKAVALFVEPSKEEGKLIITFEVEEGKYYSFSLGAGCEENGLLIVPEVRVNNLLHRGLQLGGAAKMGNKEIKGVTLNLFEPWLFHAPTALVLTLGQDEYKRVQFPYEKRGYYWVEKDGVKIKFARRGLLKRNIRASVGCKYERVKIRDVAPDASDEVKEINGKDKTLSSLLLHFVRDRRKLERYTPKYELKIDEVEHTQQFNLVKGSKHELLIECSNSLLGSDYSFTKYNLDLRKYILTGREQGLILAIKAGYIAGSPPFYERFYVAGGSGVRGYRERGIPQQGLGGEKMLFLGVEYKIPLTPCFTPFFFSEGGYAWPKSQEISLNDMEWGAGLGLKMSSAFTGNLTLSFGYGLERKDWRVHLGSGLGE